MPLYRVFLSDFPTSYFSIGAKNKHKAVQHARAEASMGRRKRTTVLKVVRILKDGSEKNLKE
jgi:hypothetical protein